MDKNLILWENKQSTLGNKKIDEGEYETNLGEKISWDRDTYKNLITTPRDFFTLNTLSYIVTIPEEEREIFTPEYKVHYVEFYTHLLNVQIEFTLPRSNYQNATVIKPKVSIPIYSADNFKNEFSSLSEKQLNILFESIYITLSIIKKLPETRLFFITHNDSEEILKFDNSFSPLIKQFKTFCENY